jgi:hypothetical protein
MGCHCKCCQRERRKLKREALRELAQTSFEYRDAGPNNVDHPEWGEPGQQLLRGAQPQYSDSVSAPAGADRPSAREISNQIFAQHEPHPNKKNASAIFWLWGQFLDHDLGLTTDAHPAEPFNIPVPAGDSHFDPEGTGTQVIPLSRSAYDPDTGTDPSNPRQQLNQISSFIDGSNVYGSTKKRCEWLQYGHHGLLKTSAGNMLPYNDGSMDNAMGKSSAFYVGGDIRANEHLGLISLHTIFVREHNYWAEKLRRHYCDLDDHELYERARVLVEAELQAITLNEFLPILLGGKEVFGKYNGYDPTVNPQMRNEFTTAAYRLGHTLVSEPYPRLEENGHHIKEMDLMLRGAFFCPWVLTNEGGVDPVIRGLATVVAEEFDGKVIDDLRNFLFGAPGEGGLDLTALNIQRGRDHGLADYNTTRKAYGLPPISSFSEVVSDPELVQKLEQLYSTPDNADLYVVLQVENHVHFQSPSGDGISMLGPTTMAILGEQAMRMRAGDRFWYQRRLPKHLLEYVESVKLSEIILRNTGIEHIQDDVMIAHPRHDKTAETSCKK